MYQPLEHKVCLTTKVEGWTTILSIDKKKIPDVKNELAKFYLVFNLSCPAHDEKTLFRVFVNTLNEPLYHLQ